MKSILDDQVKGCEFKMQIETSYLNGSNLNIVATEDKMYQSKESYRKQ